MLQNILQGFGIGVILWNDASSG